MKHLDETLRQMAREEDTPVPEGFDERLEERLATLPGGRRRLSRGVRVALIAACLCVALVGTAFAAEVLWGVFSDGQVKTLNDGLGVGYDFWVEGMTKFPVDILGEDIMADAQAQAEAEAVAKAEAEEQGQSSYVLKWSARKYQSWQEASEHIGITLASNSILDQAEHDGCAVSVSTDKNGMGMPVYLLVATDYVVDGVKVHVEALIRTEYDNDGDTHFSGAYWNEGSEVVLSNQEYTMADGSIAIVLTAQSMAYGDTSYEGRFVQDGIYYWVHIHADSPEESLEQQLKDILDAFG